MIVIVQDPNDVGEIPECQQRRDVSCDMSDVRRGGLTSAISFGWMQIERVLNDQTEFSIASLRAKRWRREKDVWIHG